MTSNRFFIRKESIQSSRVFLKGQEHHHLSKVARIKPQEKVWLFDENGREYTAVVEDISRSQTQLCILDTKTTESPRLKISLAQSVVKTKAMEMILQKTSELGITRFIPIKADRSIVKFEDNIDSKIRRWRKISLESAKQSGRAHLPEISLPVSLGNLLKEDNQAEKLYLDEHGGDCLRDVVASKINADGNSHAVSVVILVGPEGGWTEEERKKIRDHGFRAINLGCYMLKSETAAIAMVAVVSQIWKK